MRGAGRAHLLDEVGGHAPADPQRELRAAVDQVGAGGEQPLRGERQRGRQRADGGRRREDLEEARVDERRAHAGGHVGEGEEHG